MKTRIVSLMSLLVIVALLAPVSAPSIAAEAVSAPLLPMTETMAPVPSAVNDAETRVQVEKAFGQMSLIFVENQGQLDEQVAYYIQGGDKDIYFTPEGVTFALTSRKKTVDSRREMVERRLSDHAPNDYLTDDSPAMQRWAVKLDFVGANPDVRPVGEEQAETIVSYFKGPQENWHTGLPTYSRIVYRDLWLGIDLVYYGTVNQLKYEFVVHPGADPAQIRLTYRGATDVKRNAAGQLEVTTPLGGFTDDTPVAYQEIDEQRVPVEMDYRLSPIAGTAGEYVAFEGETYDVQPTTFNFSVGDYDSTRPLILDPAVIVYSGFIGGSNSDDGNGIAVDDTGNAYIIGDTHSTNFPVVGGLDLTHNGDYDVFIAKVNASGTGLIYASFLGGSNYDYGRDIAVDGAENAYVTGYTGSTGFPATSGPDLTHNGYADAFVAKIDATGTSLVYSGFLGGSENDTGQSIAVDAVGDAYVTGMSESANFPATGGSGLICNSNSDAFVVKVNATGTALVYARFFGGSSSEFGQDIVVNDMGNAYVTGTTYSIDFPTTGGSNLTYNGGIDAFVAKMNTTGTELVYAGFLGGSGDDNGHGIAVDGIGNAYVTGYTKSSDFPAVGGPGLTYTGDSDAFVAKVNAAGTELVYAGFLGGSDTDYGYDIAVDGAGNVYVTGFTRSIDFPAINGPNPIFGGGTCGTAPFTYPCQDVFIAKVNAAGTDLVYAGFLGGSGDDNGRGITVDSIGNAYITGETVSTDFPAVGGPNLTFGDGTCGTAPYTYPCSDAFVVKVNGESVAYQLELTGLEITQGIQNLLNDNVVLIEDRPTYVRAYVRSVSGTVDGVTAELIGRRDGSELLDSPLPPANRGSTVRILENPDRLQLNDSFYFELPELWRSGTVEFEFRGDSHTIVCRESAGTDNDCKTQVTFTESPTAKVQLVGVVWEENNIEHQPTWADIYKVIRQIESTFPVPQLDWDHPYDYKMAPLFFSGPPLTYTHFIATNTMLKINRLLDGCISSWLVNCQRYYLGIIIDPPISRKLSGMADGIPADVANAYLLDGFAHPHELGHTAGRYHTNYNAQRGIDPPEGGPQYHEPIDGTISQEKSGDAAFYGFDINTRQIYGPGTADLMSYGRPRWPSNWTYTHIRDHLVSRYETTAMSLALLAGEPAVLVSGVVTPAEETGNLDSVYIVESPVSVSAPDPGAYTVRFEDGAGQELVSYSFEPDFGVVDYADYTDDGSSGVGTFALLLPWNASTARIVLLHDMQQLDLRTASDNAPTVSVTYPNGGEMLAGSTVTLTWTASDLDGDPLEYVVQYSVDAGVSWQTLASVWPLTSYALNLELIAGTDQGLVRILASDGFHTSQDKSDGTFAVAKHSPQAIIQTPQNNSLYVGGQTLILEGDAYDNEDGQLMGTALSWSSSLDSVLGTGDSLAIVASTLTEGTHTITLTVQDSDGMTNTANIAVQIYRERPTLPATLSVAPDALSFLAAKDGWQTAWQPVSIRNEGDGTLAWSASADQSWIILSALEGVAETDIVVAADPAGLSLGGYTGNITITAAGAVNSPRTIEVALYVRPKQYVYLPMVLR